MSHDLTNLRALGIAAMAAAVIGTATMPVFAHAAEGRGRDGDRHEERKEERREREEDARSSWEDGMRQWMTEVRESIEERRERDRDDDDRPKASSTTTTTTSTATSTGTTTASQNDAPAPRATQRAPLLANLSAAIARARGELGARDQASSTPYREPLTKTEAAALLGGAGALGALGFALRTGATRETKR